MEVGARSQNRSVDVLFVLCAYVPFRQEDSTCEYILRGIRALLSLGLRYVFGCYDTMDSSVSMRMGFCLWGEFSADKCDCFEFKSR